MKSPLSPLVFFLLTGLLVGSIQAQTVYDHFDDGDRDGPEWDFPEILEMNFTEAGSLHIVDGPPDQVHANMNSTQMFRGDFEISMDWRDFSSTATSFIFDDPGFGMDIQAVNGGEYVSIRRHMNSSGGRISSDSAINGSNQQGGAISATAPAGLFKITRVGNVIETWYDIGLGWTLQTSFTNAFTGDVRIQSTSYTGENGIFHAASDWVSFIGTEVLPNLRIQVNGSDGPVVLPVGSPVDLTISMDANLLAGRKGDWFSWAFTPLGLYWLNSSGNWVPSMIPILGHQGPFLDLPTYTTLSSNTLPAGDYEFFIATDPFANGLPDEDDGFRWDVVHLQIQ
jgi:hypothetical protein